MNQSGLEDHGGSFTSSTFDPFCLTPRSTELRFLRKEGSQQNQGMSYLQSPSLLRADSYCSAMELKRRSATSIFLPCSSQCRVRKGSILIKQFLTMVGAEKKLSNRHRYYGGSYIFYLSFFWHLANLCQLSWPTGLERSLCQRQPMLSVQLEMTQGTTGYWLRSLQDLPEQVLRAMRYQRLEIQFLSHRSERAQALKAQDSCSTTFMWSYLLRKRRTDFASSQLEKLNRQPFTSYVNSSTPQQRYITLRLKAFSTSLSRTDFYFVSLDQLFLSLDQSQNPDRQPGLLTKKISLLLILSSPKIILVLLMYQHSNTMSHSSDFPCRKTSTCCPSKITLDRDSRLPFSRLPSWLSQVTFEINFFALKCRLISLKSLIRAFPTSSLDCLQNFGRPRRSAMRLMCLFFWSFQLRRICLRQALISLTFKVKCQAKIVAVSPIWLRMLFLARRYSLEGEQYSSLAKQLPLKLTRIALILYLLMESKSRLNQSLEFSRSLPIQPYSHLLLQFCSCTKSPFNFYQHFARIYLLGYSYLPSRALNLGRELKILNAYQGSEGISGSVVDRPKSLRCQLAFSIILRLMSFKGAQDFPYQMKDLTKELKALRQPISI